LNYHSRSRSQSYINQSHLMNRRMCCDGDQDKTEALGLIASDQDVTIEPPGPENSTQ
jgi:hypothetical protein